MCLICNLQMAPSFSRAYSKYLQNFKIILLVSDTYLDLRKILIRLLSLASTWVRIKSLGWPCCLVVRPLVGFSLIWVSHYGGTHGMCFLGSSDERISRRLDGWKKVFSSLGERITLIQSCLSHIPSYFLSFFKMSSLVALKIETLQRTREHKRHHLIS